MDDQTKIRRLTWLLRIAEGLYYAIAIVVVHFYGFGVLLALVLLVFLAAVIWSVENIVANDKQAT